MPRNASNSKPKKLILFNGPPGCGKDTLANMMKGLLGLPGTHVFKMAGALKIAGNALIGLRPDDLVDPMSMEAFKEEPVAVLGNGMTYRRLVIEISEEFMKPRFGKEIFGKLALQSMPVWASLMLCSDSGFAEEAAPFVRELGEENVLLVQIEREGKSFANDSRSHIELEGVDTVRLKNNWDLETLKEFQQVIEGWLVNGTNGLTESITDLAGRCPEFASGITVHRSGDKIC